MGAFDESIERIHARRLFRLDGRNSGFSFWLLAMAMRDLPVGAAYAVWVGIGVIGTAIFGIIWFNESLTWLRISGIVLIVAGLAAPNNLS